MARGTNRTNDVQRGIDGMCFDAEGNIIATAGWELGGPGPMLYVLSPTGCVLEAHPMPALRPTNCCFGGPDMTTLYVTTTQGHCFQVQTDRVGWAIFVNRKRAGEDEGGTHARYVGERSQQTVR